MRVVNQQVPDAVPRHRPRDAAAAQPREFARRRSRFPLHASRSAPALTRQLGQISAMDLVLGLAEALPRASTRGSGIERYIREVLSDPDRTDDFRLLEKRALPRRDRPRHVRADRLRRRGWDDVPISTAVRASTALPMVYKPVEVKGRELVDGGIVSTTNLDIAVEAGAKFVVVVNPLVPYVNDFSKSDPDAVRLTAARVSDMGFPQIGYQTFKLWPTSACTRWRAGGSTATPAWTSCSSSPSRRRADVPDVDHELHQRVDIARHGFQSVTLKLAEDYERFHDVCERHGIEISATRVRKVVKHFAAEKEKTRAWRKILEQTTGALLRQSASE